MSAPQYYPDYLELDKILDAQHPVSYMEGNEPAHDEMLFIIIHQAYELWFKQILFEVDSIIDIMSNDSINDNTPQLQTITHRINRINTILRLLVQQMDVMETMTPMDFLDFRDLLRPASGFQSWQFKLLEAKLGLKYEQRFGKQYYTSVLKPEYTKLIKDAESAPSLLELINIWLERFPLFAQTEKWEGFETEHALSDEDTFIKTYRDKLRESLAESEMDTLSAFDRFIGLDDSEVVSDEVNILSAKARRAALFIMIYRGYPMLQLPFQILQSLLDTDNLMSSWRYRHINMVRKTIGHRVGTGGSTGKVYLKGAADAHFIFREVAQLTSFLIERKHLPQLPPKIEEILGFRPFTNA